MKRLILARHAKSSWGELGLADYDRSLNKRGKRDAPQMGKRMKALGVSPDLIVSSPAKRAIKTAGKLADEMGYDRDAIVTNEILYGAHPEDTFAIAQAADDGIDTLMIVGHNPTTTDLINELTEFSIDNVPTCGIFCATFEVDSWRDVRAGSGVFVFFEYPKLLG
ncbi:TPA: phosphohistidine phosphatase [Candidatus Latescibacteria bacterium]|nr:phosphohistidine phosphatase [Candidatus Latescibacterota bacterium]|tara:strand:+ start:1135 stop:1629 length:495 start_codon:yes stop_codon:yes gene_type:complete